jgi:predicted DNA-binding protein
MQQTIRTSFTLPTSLLNRLKTTARAKNTSLADLVRTVLERQIQFYEEEELKKTYHALHKLRGISSANISDASATINETLYGKKGSWKGSDAS